MFDLILAIDQGTTGTTAVLLNARLEVLATANREFAQIFPQPGWVEHAPEAIWASVEAAVSAALAKAGFDERIYVRGARDVNYGRVAQVMAIITTAGFKKVALVTEQEKK